MSVRIHTYDPYLLIKASFKLSFSSCRINRPVSLEWKYNFFYWSLLRPNVPEVTSDFNKKIHFQFLRKFTTSSMLVFEPCM
jgi:hypothetical protein